MTWEIVFVIVLLVAALASFLAERIPTDQTAISAFVAIVVAGSLPFADRLPSVGELLTVFSNPAPMTIAAMFVLSAALDKVGLIKRMASGLVRRQRAADPPDLGILNHRFGRRVLTEDRCPPYSTDRSVQPRRSGASRGRAFAIRSGAI